VTADAPAPAHGSVDEQERPGPAAELNA
jgi:hypothetical protein